MFAPQISIRHYDSPSTSLNILIWIFLIFKIRSFMSSNLDLATFGKFIEFDFLIPIRIGIAAVLLENVDDFVVL